MEAAGPPGMPTRVADVAEAAQLNIALRHQPDLPSLAPQAQPTRWCRGGQNAQHVTRRAAELVWVFSSKVIQENGDEARRWQGPR